MGPEQKRALLKCDDSRKIHEVVMKETSQTNPLYTRDELLMRHWFQIGATLHELANPGIDMKLILNEAIAVSKILKHEPKATSNPPTPKFAPIDLDHDFD